MKNERRRKRREEKGGQQRGRDAVAQLPAA